MSVSLGVFSEKTNALNYVRELQAKGFNVNMRERIDESIEYWLEALLVGKVHFLLNPLR